MLAFETFQFHFIVHNKNRPKGIRFFKQDISQQWPAHCEKLPKTLTWLENNAIVFLFLSTYISTYLFSYDTFFDIDRHILLSTISEIIDSYKSRGAQNKDCEIINEREKGMQ